MKIRWSSYIYIRLNVVDLVPLILEQFPLFPQVFDVFL